MTARAGVAQSANLTTAHIFAMALQRSGVSLMFGQSIPTQIHLAAPAYGIAQIAYRTEHAGAIMADGYARIAGRIGVVTAQNGPAATLLVPGLAEALKASVPILALVQEVALPLLDRNAFQEIDHFDLFRGCCKWIRRIHSPERVDDYVDMAITAATSGRPGPAVLLCPLDVIGSPAAAPTARDAVLGRYPLDRTLAAPDRIAHVAALLAKAEHPLLVAGGGVHLSGAVAELCRVQDLASLPVATTVMGKGAVDEGHPLSLGVAGYFMGTGGMAKFMRPVIEEADLILFVGARTNQNGTDSWSLFPPGARYAHIDIDPLEIGRNYESIRLAGDAKLTLAALADALASLDLSRRKSRGSELAGRIAAARAAHRGEAAPLLSSDARPIRPERLMGDLARVLTPDAIAVADASYASIWVANYLPGLKAGMRFLTPRGLAGLGWGLPLALGAKLAAPDRPVFCVVGDGGFAHAWSELETARRHGIKVVVTVLNNQSLAYQKHAEDLLFGAHTPAVDLGPVDHASIARACGLNGVRIEHPSEYGPALEQAIAADQATVIDVLVEPDAVPPVTAFEGRVGRLP
jgi:acetolactate synthase I/II/III large subunit